MRNACATMRCLAGKTTHNMPSPTVAVQESSEKASYLKAVMLASGNLKGANKFKKARPLVRSYLHATHECCQGRTFPPPAEVAPRKHLSVLVYSYSSLFLLATLKERQIHLLPW
uniref:Uncharacterized protein n=1 Tax=Grammatophora oceanica TaxID=210454 RepID=A0A7S1Y0A5_9STRA